MKKSLLIFSCLVFFTCNKNDNNNNCNFLFDVGVNAQINLNLPQFNQLLFPVNAVRFEGQGNNGIILVRINSSTLIAWDGADPNHAPTACSRLEVDLGTFTATCGCQDGNVYNILTGQLVSENPQPCTLKPYRVENLGNNIYLISN